MFNELESMIGVFKITSNDVDKSFDELEKYEDYLIKKEPDIYQIKEPTDGDKWAIEILRKSDLQYRRRSYVRTFFSYVEGVIWGLSQLCITSGNNNLTKEDLLKLEEKKEININGQIEVKKQRQSLAERIKFVLNTFVTTMDINLVLDFGTQDWISFQEAIKIRDNITHPKDKSLLVLNKNDVEKVIISHKWFSKILDNILSKWK
ncbi:MAG: hypothetical protein MUO34_05590 [Ignavibacteriaceae bacterium]|nr:hypothetical protein [Ignavibacteriaceae bacterium]